VPRLPFIEFVPDANSNTRGPVKGRIDRAAIPSVRPRDGSRNDPLSYPIGKRRKAVATAIGGSLVAAETAWRKLRGHLWLPSFDSTHNHRRNFGEQWRHWACANDVAPATMDRRMFQPPSSSVPWSPRNKNRQILRYSTTSLGTADEFGDAASTIRTAAHFRSAIPPLSRGSADGAPDYESGGREFESLRARQ
jgi:hypothetical protein